MYDRPYKERHMTAATNLRWKDAGAAWGERAADWAYLFEPYARNANEFMFDQLAIGEETHVLDVACGAGLAAQFASRRGATVTGIDASAALIDIARARTLAADFHVGDMFALPFPDDAFDVVTSFNGIWKGCEGALREARRVLRPAGCLGLTFWGPLERVGLLPYFVKTIELSPVSHQEATVEQGDTGRVIEAMLTATGFIARRRGSVT